MPQLPSEDILGLMKTFSLYAKMPKEYWDKIRIAEKPDEEGNKTFKELSDIYKREYFDKKMWKWKARICNESTSCLL